MNLVTLKDNKLRLIVNAPEGDFYSNRPKTYNKALASCESFEIENEEALPFVKLHCNESNGMRYFHAHSFDKTTASGRIRIEEGDLFPLPKGITFRCRYFWPSQFNGNMTETTEEVWLDFTGEKKKDVWLTIENKKPVCPKCGLSMHKAWHGCDNSKSSVPDTVKTEPEQSESQEDLWNKVVDYCNDHYSNDIRVVEFFVKNFTITRKP